jgi:hypothetical protein
MKDWGETERQTHTATHEHTLSPTLLSNSSLQLSLQLFSPTLSDSLQLSLQLSPTLSLSHAKPNHDGTTALIGGDLHRCELGVRVASVNTSVAEWLVLGAPTSAVVVVVARFQAHLDRLAVRNHRCLVRVCHSERGNNCLRSTKDQPMNVALRLHSVVCCWRRIQQQ